TGSALIENGALTNSGTLTVAGSGNTLDSETVTNTDAHITIGSGATLTLDATTITGGDLANEGTLHIEGAGTTTTLDGVTVSGGGTIQVDFAGSKVTLALGNGSSITGGLISIGSSGVLDLAGSSLSDGSITIVAGGKLVGYGTISDAITNGGLIEAKGGLLHFTSAVTDPAGGAGPALIDDAA